MDKKYRTWHKVQGISCISYAIFIILLFVMIYTDLSYAFIVIIAVLATISLITTITSGIIRAFIAYRMGLKSTKKDWLIVGIAFILAIIYLTIKQK